MNNELQLFYANHSEYLLSSFDLGLKFIRMGNAGVNPQPQEVFNGLSPMNTATALEALTVNMSLEHAKTMVASLLKAVIDHERNFGKIAVPLDAQNLWNQFVNNHAN